MQLYNKHNSSKVLETVIFCEIKIASACQKIEIMAMQFFENFEWTFSNRLCCLKRWSLAMLYYVIFFSFGMFILIVSKSVLEFKTKLGNKWQRLLLKPSPVLSMSLVLVTIRTVHMRVSLHIFTTII